MSSDKIITLKFKSIIRREKNQMIIMDHLKSLTRIKKKDHRILMDFNKIIRSTFRQHLICTLYDKNHLHYTFFKATAFHLHLRENKFDLHFSSTICILAVLSAF
ncbi:hypothetical protein ACKWTF_007550 [Chironomus riparius]